MNCPSRQIYQAINASKGGAALARSVAWAGNSAERRRGLLGRTGLNSGEGIYLAPCEWLHTFGMQFPIDVVFLSKSGRVLAVHHSLKPNRVSRIVLRAEGALELAQGSLRFTNTEVGDVVEFLNISVDIPTS